GKGTIEAMGAGAGTLQATFLSGIGFELPGARVTDQTVVAVPLGGLTPHEGRLIEGILGYDFMSRFVVDVDYANRKIRLYDPASWVYEGEGDRIPISLLANIPHARAAVADGDREPVAGLFT